MPHIYDSCRYLEGTLLFVTIWYRDSDVRRECRVFYNVIESYKFLLSEKSHLMIFPIKFSGMSWGKSLLAYYQKIKTIKTPEFK